MSYTSMAIIGTAGRREDKARLTHHHYQRMIKACTTLIIHLGIDPSHLKLISGGAAWADHLVVTLARLRVVEPSSVTLYMPTSLSIDGFRGDNEKEEKTAQTANYYHRLFSQCTGKQSIQDILEIGEQGANLVAGNGNFFSRNSDVAKSVSPDGILLAFTFGSSDTLQRPWTIRSFDGTVSAKDAGLNDGGTADCWNKCTGRKFHCLLGDMDHEDHYI